MLNRRALAAASAVILGLAAVAVVALQPDSWVEEGMALSAQGAIGIDVGGWNYAIPVDVMWQGADGSWRDGGRPECLPPTGRLEGPVRFEAVEVETPDGLGWRQVVWVSCLG